MLGVSQTVAQAGVGISFWGAYGGYGYGHGPITAMAFGLPAGDWTSTPAGDWDTAGTGTMTTAGLNVDWSSPNTWVSVLYGDPDSTAGPWNSPLPGNPEVLWGYLDDGNASSQAPAVTVTGLAAKFPSGYVVQTIAAQDANPITIANVSVNDGGTPQTLTYSTSWHLYDWYGPVAGANKGTALLSTPSGTFSGDTLNIQCDLKGSTGDRSVLCGFVVTDKPVVTSCLPAETTILPGTPFTLSATAIGLGTISYQWKHNGSDISGANGPTYTVSSADTGDSGTYEVVASSNLYPANPATSETVSVTVSIPATVTWDADTGTGGAQDGSGTWDLSGTNWWTGSANQAWSNLDFAVFGDGGTGSSTITLATDVTASGLTFSSGSHTITGASKTIGLFGDTTIATNGDATLSVVLAGTGTTTKTGTGTLTLDTKGSLSGPINVQQGTLNLPSSPPGYWYQWLLNSSVINLSPGTTLTCDSGAFGWYGNNNATGLTINIDGAICQPNGAFGIGYNLTGGIIGTGSSRLDMGRSGGFDSFITSLASSTTSVVNPAGGIQFRTDSGQTDYTFTAAAGTTSNGIDLDVPTAVYGGGSVVKAGPGTMRLSATNSYSGGTTVNGGKLIVSGQATGTTTINAGTLVVSGQISGPLTTVNAGTLEVTGKLTNTGDIWLKDDTELKVSGSGVTPAISTTGTMSVGTDLNNPSGMNTLTFNSLTSTSVAPVTVGNLFLDSPVTVKIGSVSPAVGQYPLMIFTGSNVSINSIVLDPVLPSGITATLVDDTAGPSKSIYLDVTAVTVPYAVWTGVTSSVWDINTTSNWTVGGSPANYLEGNVVTFDDTAVNTSVTLNTSVNPVVLTFANETKNYTLSGSGAIAGATTLTKTGAGTLTVSTTNTYSGVTTITGGKLVLLDTTASLMSGGIVDNSVLEISAVSGPLSYNSSITGTGTLTKSGSDTLTITGGLALTTPITVAAGTLEMQAKSGDAPYVINSGGTLKFGYSTGGGYANTNLKIHGDGAAATTGFYLKGGSTYNVSGTLELLDAPTTLRQYGSGLASIGIFDINSTGLSCSAAASGSATDSNVKFVSLGYGMSVQIDTGANTATGDFILNGPLDVDHTGNGFYKKGTGTLRLNAAATANNKNVRILGGSIICGIADCLGTNAALQINTGGVLALNGFNQTVMSLYFGNAQQASGTWGATGSGASHIDNTRFSGTGVLTVTTAPDFSIWAAANAPGQTASQDHDGDGVTNGVEYFMGLSGSGFTANPGVVSGKVSWPKGASYVGAYGTDYVVQKSSDLSTWSDVLISDPNLTNGSPLEYTLPTGSSKVFTRLKVTGP